MENNKVKVLFIGGYGRNGSTLLDRMLGQMPGFFSAGELRYIWERGFQENQLCGCGHAFRSCDFWNAVGDEAFGGLGKVEVEKVVALQQSVDRLRYIPKLMQALKTGPEGEFAERLRNYGAVLEQLYKAIKIVSGAQVIVDSSKNPAYAFLLRALPSIDLYLVHLVRDSRAVAYSRARRRVRPEITDRLELMPRWGPVMSALGWDVYNHLLGSLSRLTPKTTLCRYEDLVQNPIPRLQQLLAQAGLDGPDRFPFIGKQEITLNVNHTVSGNPMRFQTGIIKLNPDEEWKTEMKGFNRRVVTLLTWPLLLKYGYLTQHA